MKAHILIGAALLLAACSRGGHASDAAANRPGPEARDQQSTSGQMIADRGGRYAPEETQGRRSYGASRGLPPGSLHVKPVQIIDPNGFARPMVAATVLIPVNWQARGGVVWNIRPGCGGGYNFNWGAGAPDNSMGAAIIPRASWSMNNAGIPPQPGCAEIRAQNVRQYLQWVAQRFHPRARALDYRPRPDLLRGFEQLNRRTPMPMGEFRSWTEAGEVLIGYRQNGMDERETLAAVVVFTENRMRNGMGGIFDILSAQALPGFAFHAPNGQLNFKMAEAIRSSIRPNPQWDARINQMTAQTQAFANQQAMKRSQIIAQNGEDISNIINRGYEQRSKVMDNVARRESEAIRDVQTYNDPNSPTGQVELSNQYDNAWRLNDGTYVLTNDPSFNPYQATGQNGTKLEPIR